MGTQSADTYVPLAVVRILKGSIVDSKSAEHIETNSRNLIGRGCCPQSDSIRRRVYNQTLVNKNVFTFLQGYLLCKIHGGGVVGNGRWGKKVGGPT